MGFLQKKYSKASLTKVFDEHQVFFQNVSGRLFGVRPKLKDFKLIKKIEQVNVVSNSNTLVTKKEDTEVKLVEAKAEFEKVKSILEATDQVNATDAEVDAAKEMLETAKSEFEAAVLDATIASVDATIASLVETEKVVDVRFQDGHLQKKSKL